MDFLSKSKTYFDKNEKDFFDKIFSYMDEIEPDKINIDSLKTFSDKNTLENITKINEKLDKIIEKYNLGKILKNFEKEFIPLEISNVTQTNVYSKMKNPTKKNSIEYEMKRVKGGSAASSGRGAKVLVKLIFENIKSHGIIKGSIITFVEIIIIIFLSKIFMFLLTGFIEENLMESTRDILNKSLQKIITFYYRLRFLILNEKILVDNYREIITLPYSEIIPFSGYDQNAVLIPETREAQLKQHLDNLLAQYNTSQDYRIYSNLSVQEQSDLLRRINQIENELVDLLQPAELILIQNVPNENVFNNNFDARNDIVAQPIQMTDETKNVFKFFLRFCLIGYNSNTTTGGRTKTRNNKRKTNKYKKKRKLRTKKNKRNSKST